MKKIFLSGAYLFTVQYCIPLFSTSRPLIRKNFLLGATPSHTQLQTLKPMLSNTLVASNTTGNNWSPVKATHACYSTVHSKLLNIPRIINVFTYLANFWREYSLLMSSSFALYWSSCISTIHRISDTPNLKHSNKSNKIKFHFHEYFCVCFINICSITFQCIFSLIWNILLLEKTLYRKWEKIYLTLNTIKPGKKFFCKEIQSSYLVRNFHCQMCSFFKTKNMYSPYSYRCKSIVLVGTKNYLYL